MVHAPSKALAAEGMSTGGGHWLIQQLHTHDAFHIIRFNRRGQTPGPEKDSTQGTGGERGSEELGNEPQTIKRAWYT